MLDESIELLLEESKEHMEKSLEHLSHELNAIRAGRATPNLLSNVRVDYYGTQTPLQQMANVSAPQPDLLVVQPWDRSALNDIEKAIQGANLGLNPSNDGTIIRIPVPTPTEERRRELVKAARGKGEESKIAVRNIRRHSKDEIKKTQKSENLPEDMRYEGEEALDKITNGFVDRIDKALDRKEAEIMEV